MIFGNRSLGVHLLRGTLGAAALWWSLSTIDSSWVPSLFLMPMALWMFKGCPMCWTVGLFESAAHWIHRRNEQAMSDT
ncbi:hypothetical protein [Roseateles sp.]|uniref:hypothetical protein n=1 Tax=Roseateles sp. TaxID=1971397 RepID=UPI0032653E99